MKAIQEEKKAEEIGLFIRLVVKDKDGKVIKDTGQMKSRSFVIAFLQYLSGFLRNTDVTATDTSNTGQTIWNSARFNNEQGQVETAINISTSGIVIGTGDTAPTNINYKLATQLTEGVGLGNITHNACTIDEVSAIVGGNVDLIIVRSFTNLTGSTITVKEAGIYMKTFWVTDSRYFCIVRDVLGAPVDVPNLCSLTVFYTARTTV